MHVVLNKLTGDTRKKKGQSSIEFKLILKKKIIK